MNQLPHVALQFGPRPSVQQKRRDKRVFRFSTALYQCVDQTPSTLGRQVSNRCETGPVEGAALTSPFVHEDLSTGCGETGEPLRSRATSDAKSQLMEDGRSQRGGDVPVNESRKAPLISPSGGDAG